MLIFFIFAIVCVIIGLVLSHHFYFNDTPQSICFGLALAFLFLTATSAFVSFLAHSTEYTTVDSISYTSDSGLIETLEDGPYYKKGDNYYIQSPGLAYWIPFYPCDYVEINLPNNTTPPESPTENETKKLCTSCGNKLNVEDKFCADCGTKVKE